MTKHEVAKSNLEYWRDRYSRYIGKKNYNNKLASSLWHMVQTSKIYLDSLPVPEHNPENHGQSPEFVPVAGQRNL